MSAIATKPKTKRRKAARRGPDFATKDGLATVYVGDCRRVMADLCAKGYRADLIVADPPFNIGRAYADWNDRQKFDDYMRFTREWLAGAVGILSPTGALVVNCWDNIAGDVVVRMRDEHGMHLARWIIWHYRFGQCVAGNFIQSKQHVLYFVRDREKYTRNMDAVLEPSDRATLYNDPRTATKKQGTPGMRPPLDVWQGTGFCRVQGNNRERRRVHDNQLPERYLRRVVLALSNEGDHVFDPFTGSGTTGTIARAHKRVYTGSELTLRYARSAFARIRKGPVTDASVR